MPRGGRTLVRSWRSNHFLRCPHCAPLIVFAISQCAKEIHVPRTGVGVGLCEVRIIDVVLAIVSLEADVTNHFFFFLRLRTFFCLVSTGSAQKAQQSAHLAEGLNPFNGSPIVTMGSFELCVSVSSLRFRQCVCSFEPEQIKLYFFLHVFNAFYEQVSSRTS